MAGSIVIVFIPVNPLENLISIVVEVAKTFFSPRAGGVKWNIYQGTLFSLRSNYEIGMNPRPSTVHGSGNAS